MIALSHADTWPPQERVLLTDLRDRIERLARSRGHDDPPDFFGEFAHELVNGKHLSKDGYLLEPKEHIFWLARQRLKDYHRRYYRRRASQRIPIKYVREYPEEVDACSKVSSTSDVEPECESRSAAVFHDALCALTPRARDILERKHLLDQANLDIARLVGISANGVRSSLYRSRQKLERELRTVLNLPLNRPTIT